jgi:putative redox protein
MAHEMIVRFPGGKRVDAEYKGFEIRTDQAVHQGGEASAPAPFDLFLASIATCAGIYVLSFGQNRGIDMSSASMSMRMTRDAEKGRIVRITLDIRLPAGFPKKYRRAVIKSINGCAVKAHMEIPPEFEILTTFPS